MAQVAAVIGPAGRVHVGQVTRCGQREAAEKGSGKHQADGDDAGWCDSSDTSIGFHSEILLVVGYGFRRQRVDAHVTTVEHRG